MTRVHQGVACQHLRGYRWRLRRKTLCRTANAPVPVGAFPNPLDRITDSGQFHKSHSPTTAARITPCEGECTLARLCQERSGKCNKLTCRVERDFAQPSKVTLNRQVSLLHLPFSCQRALACAGRDAASAGSPGWLELQRLASHAPARFRAAREESDLHTRSNRGASLTARRREGASVRACYRASVTVWLCQLASQELSQERLRAVTRAVNVECAQGFTGYCPDSCLTLHAPLTVV